jgi:hypothetical protein
MNYLHPVVFLGFVSFASAASNNTISNGTITVEIIDLGTDLTDDQVMRIIDVLFIVYPHEREYYNPDAADYLKITFDPDFTKFAAEALGDSIRVNAQRVSEQPEDLDFITHELMHLVQSSKLSYLSGF